MTNPDARALIADASPPATHSADLPFPVLFAEEMLAESIQPAPAFDITSYLTQFLGRRTPTGERDKILILSNPHDPHADAVTFNLVKRGAPVYRFHPEEFLQNGGLRLEIGAPGTKPGMLQLPNGDLDLSEIKSVWFRRPNLPLTEPLDPFRSRSLPEQRTINEFIKGETEIVLRGMFDLLEDAFWVSHPRMLKASDSKLGQLKQAQRLGLAIPRTLVTNDPQRAREFYADCGGEMIVKIFGAALSSAQSVKGVYTSKILPEHLAELDRVAHMPCLFQENVEKDVEIRATVIGRRMFAAEIHSQQSKISNIDWRRDDLEHIPYYPHQLPARVEQACLKMLDHYQLNYGAFDLIRRPDGEYVFLEVNGNGQWLWIQELTGMPMIDAMADLLVQGALG